MVVLKLLLVELRILFIMPKCRKNNSNYVRGTKGYGTLSSQNSFANPMTDVRIWCLLSLAQGCSSTFYALLPCGTTMFY